MEKPLQLPETVGHLDDQSLALLGRVVGMGMRCELLDGHVRPHSKDPHEQYSAAAVILHFEPERRSPVQAAGPLSLLLRPAVLPDYADFALQCFRTTSEIPVHLLTQKDRNPKRDPRPRCFLETGLSSMFYVQKIEICNRERRVPFADSDGDAGFFGFDDRIAFSGSLAGKLHCFVVDLGRYDDQLLHPFPLPTQDVDFPAAHEGKLRVVLEMAVT